MFDFSFKEAFQSFLLAARASPNHLTRLAIFNLLAGIGPAITLYLLKVIIDGISRSLGLPYTNIWEWIVAHPLFWGSLIGFVAVHLLLDSLETVASFEANSFRDNVVGETKLRIFKKIAEFRDIALFEDTELLNTLQLALSGIPKLTYLSHMLNAILAGFFGFVPVFLLAFSIAWWIPLSVFLLAIPSVYVQFHYSKKGWRVEEAQTGIVRRMKLAENVLTQEEHAKELRVLQLQSFFLDQWRNLFRNAYDEVYELRKQGTRSILLWSILSGLGIGVPFLYVVWATMSGIYTLGDLALYAGIVLQVRRSLYILIASTSEIHETALGTSPILNLLSMKASMQDSSEQGSVAKIVSGIAIQNLSFTYPHSEKPVLEEINLTIGPGETVAIVGHNGAGKSTLAKLLCRLYDPQEGSISWDGQDIRSVELETLRQNIAVLMQDYARFPTTARENIGFGWLPGLNDDPSIWEAVRKSGLEPTFNAFSDSLETPLTKQLDNGTDLSAGQWQRVAFARTIIRSAHAQLLILDEPTAALDPNVEDEMYGLFHEITRDKMAVIISHRLSLARTADKIVTLNEGRIVEVGTHDDLIAQNGLYSHMFNLQASGYLGTGDGQTRLKENRLPTPGK